MVSRTAQFDMKFGRRGAAEGLGEEPSNENALGMETGPAEEAAHAAPPMLPSPKDFPASTLEGHVIEGGEEDEEFSDMESKQAHLALKAFYAQRDQEPFPQAIPSQDDAEETEDAKPSRGSNPPQDLEDDEEEPPAKAKKGRKATHEDMEEFEDAPAKRKQIPPEEPKVRNQESCPRRKLTRMLLTSPWMRSPKSSLRKGRSHERRLKRMTRKHTPQPKGRKPGR